MQVAFEQDKHEDVLNQCVAQFEPDSAEFKNVSFCFGFLLLTDTFLKKAKVGDAVPVHENILFCFSKSAR